jgi:hypothetical protein
MPVVSAYGERIAALEVEVTELRRSVDSMDKKLDELLAIRWKGAGAFWLAAGLLGTGIVGMLTQFLHYIGAR